jgi:uncharacterized protein (DUF488 family)
MCSEAVWWRCHRRIIADHLMEPGKASPAQLTASALVDPDGGRVTYPRP